MNELTVAVVLTYVVLHMVRLEEKFCMELLFPGTEILKTTKAEGAN